MLRWFIGIIGCSAVRNVLWDGRAGCPVARDGLGIAGCSVVSQWFFGITGWSVVRDILWDSKMNCGQSMGH